MMRDTRELRRDNCGRVYEAEAVPMGAKTTPCYYKTTKTIKVVQVDGSVKVAYMYGEHTFSYSEEERDAYREEQKALRETKKERKAMLDAIMAHYNSMSDEELKKVLDTLA